eukprot:1158807-Pelagomonas_calceolata.AAC.3
MANPRILAWFMKSLRRAALLGGAELNRCCVPIAFVANSKLVWAPTSFSYAYEKEEQRVA